MNLETQDDRDLSPRQVAEAIGVSESSLKRWCDRGDLAVRRTAGGHRRIPRAAVVRFLREQGFDPKRPDLLGLPAGTRREAREAREVLPAITEALATGNRDELLARLTGLYLAGRSLAEIADGVVAPAFAAIGNRWAQGTLQVYEEHRAVVIAQYALHELARVLAPPLLGAPRAFCATLAGDPYVLPITLAEASLLELGWDAISLGPNHPLESLLAALHRLHPRLVCIDVSHVECPRDALEALTRLHEAALEAGCALVAGGRELCALGDELEVTAVCGSMGELMNVARALEPDVGPSS